MSVMWIDQIKSSIHQQISKIYKDAKSKAPPEEFKEFESWFWKIRPHLDVDLTKYKKPNDSETSGPNFKRSDAPNNEIVTKNL